MAFFRLEAKVQSDIGAVFEFLLEMLKALFLIEPLLLFNVLKKLDTKRDQIHEVYRFVAEIDAALSLSALRESLPYYARPTLTEPKKSLSGQDIYHPLVDDFVANSVELSGKSMLLTGSNMSGKTTFIRTVGINAIMGQAFNTCFARAFTLPRLKVHSAIRITDDLMSEKSYYFEEVLTIRQMLEASEAKEPCLFLLDELFKGTNTVERVAAGASVLKYLNQHDHFVLVATHDLELAAYLRDKYDLYHFTEVIEDDSIVFDYQLKSGRLQTTNAIRILELNQYPPQVVRKARQFIDVDKNTLR
ncbi:MAG: hypothetical protein RIG62_31425 [Cyclobacteriaceae bacterium]|jgi:DNA mismatch repair ATPase MutS